MSSQISLSFFDLKLSIYKIIQLGISLKKSRSCPFSPFLPSKETHWVSSLKFWFKQIPIICMKLYNFVLKTWVKAVRWWEVKIAYLLPVGWCKMMRKRRDGSLVLGVVRKFKGIGRVMVVDSNMKVNKSMNLRGSLWMVCSCWGWMI